MTKSKKKQSKNVCGKYYLSKLVIAGFDEIGIFHLLYSTAHYVQFTLKMVEASAETRFLNECRVFHY